MIAFYKLWDKMNNNEIVTTETLDKLCEYLKCQPDEILEYIPNTPAEETSPDEE